MTTVGGGRSALFVTCWLVVLCLTLTPGRAMAQTCVDDVSGRRNSCSSNDVRLTNLSIRPGGIVDGCDFPGDTATVNLEAELLSGAVLRYDVGIFVALDGGDAKTGSCLHDYLHPVTAGVNAPYDATSGVGPYLNAEGGSDVCGDIEQGVLTIYFLAPLTIPCEDLNEDGTVDTGGCTSWDNQSDENCDSVDDAVPGTGAKCNCDRYEIEGLTISSTTTTTSSTTTTSTTTTSSTSTSTTTTSTTSTTTSTTSTTESTTTTTTTSSTSTSTTTTTTESTTTTTTSTTSTTTTTESTTTTTESTTTTTESTTSTTSTTTTESTTSTTSTTESTTTTTTESTTSTTESTTSTTTTTSSTSTSTTTTTTESTTSTTESTTSTTTTTESTTSTTESTTTTTQSTTSTTSTTTSTTTTIESTTSTTSTTTSSTTTTTLAGCTSDDECVDPDLCTVDRCEQGTCVHDPVGALPPESVCNDMQDNDCDGPIDCQDADCNGITPCPRIRKDPTLIRFGAPGAGRDFIQSHGKIALPFVDLSRLQVGWLLSNARGAIFRGTLAPGQLRTSPSGRVFRFFDRGVRFGRVPSAGIYRARLRPLRDGSGFSYNVQAYGDLSAATDAEMAMQIYVGDRVFIMNDTWIQTPTGWRAPKDH